MLKVVLAFVIMLSCLIMAFMSQECCETSSFTNVSNITIRESNLERLHHKLEMCYKASTGFFRRRNKKIANAVARQSQSTNTKLETISASLNETSNVQLMTNSERCLNFWKQNNVFVQLEMDYLNLIIAILFFKIVLELVSKNYDDKKCNMFYVKIFSDILYFPKLYDTRKDKLHSCIDTWTEKVPKHTRDGVVFPLHSSYCRRLASFCYLRFNDLKDNISFITLSDAGFYFSADKQEIKCEGCNRVLQIDTLNTDSDPTEAQFHNDYCSFLNKVISNESSKNSTNQLTSDLDGDGGIGCEVSTDISNNFAVKEEIQLKTNQIEEDKSVRQCERDFNDNSPRLNGAAAMSYENSNGSLENNTCGPSQTSELHLDHLDSKYDSVSCDSGYTSDQDLIFVGADNIFFESQKKANLLKGPGDCPKNPGHYAYFPVFRLKLEQLPSKTRCPETLEFLKLFSKLTVKLTVNFTSDHRHRKDPLFKSTVSRVGTGFIPINIPDNPFHQASINDQRKWKNVKAVMKKLVKKDKEFILIETNRHVVYDLHEAVSTAVEFFSDDENKKAIKSLKIVSVETSDKIGDQRITLVCQTSDQNFVRHIKQTKKALLEIANHIPTRAKKAMTKKLFIIEHPHGGEKVVSYGDSVQVKYQLLHAHQRKTVLLQRVKNNDLANHDINNLRKMLLYAADTCEGSSGAPVITFARSPTDDQYVLDVWVHNGQSKTHGLGCSVMKECTSQDIEFIPSQELANESDSEDEPSLGNQSVQSPVFKVLQNPSSQEHVTYQKRFASFRNWHYSEIMRPELLARAGFYNAGYQDCVRCFQCGLGLRSWKTGDDVNFQHQKHRPSCPFLQTQLRLNASSPLCVQDENLPNDETTEDVIVEDTSSILGQVSVDESLSISHVQDSNRSIVNREPIETRVTDLKLLEKEHEMLKVQLMCKVCRMAPVKDLFLPCGELSTCSDCSKLLTQCPSCNKQIMATVTVYFS